MLSGEVLSGCLGQTLTQYLTRISQNVWKVQSTGCHPRMVATMRMPDLPCPTIFPTPKFGLHCLISSVNQTITDGIRHFDCLCKMCMLLSRSLENIFFRLFVLTQKVSVPLSTFFSNFEGLTYFNVL